MSSAAIVIGEREKCHLQIATGEREKWHLQIATSSNL